MMMMPRVVAVVWAARAVRHTSIWCVCGFSFIADLELGEKWEIGGVSCDRILYFIGLGCINTK